MVSGRVPLVFLKMQGYLGSTRALLVLPDVCGHSGHSQNPVAVHEVVVDTLVTISLQLALLDFTADKVSNSVETTVAK